MASNRHLGRMIALQILFEHEFRTRAKDTKLDLDELIARDVARYHVSAEDQAFVDRLVRGVIEHQKELDAILQPIAPEWPIEQIARVDRAVLRLGLYELMYEKDVPPK